MLTIAVAITLALLLVYLYRHDIFGGTPRRRICNDEDGRCYSVVTKFSDPSGASERLALINKFGIDLLRHLREKYIWNKSGGVEAQSIVKYLMSNYNADNIIENAPVNAINTSYVDDKGRVYALCLREKQSKRDGFHDMDMLHFVAMHEMAHMANRGFGHEEDFWTVFKFILREAHEAGLYSPIDYAKFPINYCGLNVGYNPYFNEYLPDIK